jgi:hypothetical protein
MTRFIGTLLILGGLAVLAFFAFYAITWGIAFVLTTGFFCVAELWSKCFEGIGAGILFVLLLLFGGGMLQIGWRLWNSSAPDSLSGRWVGTIVALAIACAIGITFLERSKSSDREFQAKCRAAGTTFATRARAPVRSIAHDWKPGWTPRFGTYELDSHGRIGSAYGAALNRPADLDFVERRYSPLQRRIPGDNATYVRESRDGSFYAVRELSADVLVMHDVSGPGVLAGRGVEQGLVQYTLTVSDQRTGDTLGTMVYWVDHTERRACGANSNGAINEAAFIRQAIEGP